MRFKNIHIHIDAPMGSGKYEVARLIKEVLEEKGAAVELRYPEQHKHREEAFGFSETTVFIDMQVSKSIDI